MEIQEWGLAILGSSTGAAAFLAIAGYLGRSQLSHWLNKDLEKIKAGYERELEAYKVSLIAEVERTKATQDVRKSMALKIAEMKFSAIDRLHRALASEGSLIIALLQSERGPHWMEQLKRASANSAELMSASFEASIFLEFEEQVIAYTFVSNVTNLIGKATKSAEPLERDVLQPLADEFFVNRNKIVSMLAKRIASMMAMA